MATARALFPRWSAFILTGLIGSPAYGGANRRRSKRRTSTGGLAGFMCSGRGVPRPGPATRSPRGSSRRA